MEAFFNKINYSASNEDSESERLALNLNSKDSVLCITGSGARCLDLLIDSPKEIVSIDFNPSQNFLLELKIAAYRELTYNDMIAFLGISYCENRIITFSKLKTHLSPEASDFWDKHLSLIRTGVLYAGTWEQLLRKILKYSFFRRRKIDELLLATSIDKQKNIWVNKWDNFSWRLFLRLLSSRFLWTKIIREPGAKLIPKDFNIYGYMKSRLDHLAFNFKLSENHYANLLFNGRYLETCLLPHHLRRENFELVRKNLDCIEIVTASLTDFLPHHRNRFSKYSLSDFSSYAEPEIYHRIWKNIIYSAKPGAMFCERYFLIKQNPEKMFTEIKRDATKETFLCETDISSIYTFGVGVIN